MKYELFLVSGEYITAFESRWQFKDYEQLFIKEGNIKRNFTIARITHDIYDENEHVIRLYCQEKKVYKTPGSK